MRNNFTKWLKAAGIRAVKTVAQTAVATVGTSVFLGEVNWLLGNVGTQRLTIAHELMHWYLHRKYFMLLSLLDEDAENMSCEVEPSDYSDELTTAQKAHWFAEWQANALAFRVTMPDALFVRAIHEARATAPYTSLGFYVEDMSAPGTPGDNACAENFFSIFKTECIYLEKPKTPEQVA